MEGLKRFQVSSRLPTDFNSLLILLTVNSLCTDELLFLMWVTEFNKYLSRIFTTDIFCKGELHETHCKMPLTQLKATVKIFKWPVVHNFSLSESQSSQNWCVFLKNHPPLLSEGYLWWKTSEFWMKYFFQVISVKTEPTTDTSQHEWMGYSTLSIRPPIWDYHAQLSSRILPPLRAGGPPQLLKNTENEQEEPATDKQVELLFRWYFRSGS